ncbi:MAG: hypothetical protein AAFV07_13465, partial [Bacteroidota bacterium]
MLPLVFICFLPISLISQVYVTGGNTRHRFAQMTLGGDFLYTPSAGEISVIEDGIPTAYSLPAALHPRLQIGGTHFWGHTEFYVAFALGTLLDNSLNQESEINYSPGVETGFKIYPWRLEKKKLRPYIGTAFSIPGFRLRSSPTSIGPFVNPRVAPLNFGATFQTGNVLLELGARYQTGTNTAYYTNRIQT